jgi:hypothetical protein
LILAKTPVYLPGTAKGEKRTCCATVGHAQHGFFFFGGCAYLPGKKLEICA